MHKWMILIDKIISIKQEVRIEEITKKKLESSILKKEKEVSNAI